MFSRNKRTSIHFFICFNHIIETQHELKKQLQQNMLAASASGATSTADSPLGGTPSFVSSFTSCEQFETNLINLSLKLSNLFAWQVLFEIVVCDSSLFEFKLDLLKKGAFH